MWRRRPSAWGGCRGRAPRRARAIGVVALVVACKAHIAAVAKPVKTWRILGPFIIGKNELDGEPWLTSNVSELVGGGRVRPRKFTADESGGLLVQWPEVDWQGLVNSVGGHELLEWQALAVGSFKAPSAGAATVSCAGVAAFTLDGRPAPFVGDQYGAGFPGHRVHLHEGAHRISIRLRGKLRAQFRCSVDFAEDARPQLFGGHFLMVPDVFEGMLPSDLAALPVTNTHPNEWLHNVRVSSTSSAGEAGLDLHPEQPWVESLAPGQTARLLVRLHMGSRAAACPNGGLRLVVEAGRSTTSAPFLLPPLRCRTRGQSFVFTFVDADGSLQHAAAVMPEARDIIGAGGSPVLVTLHGTSISASDSADSYKVMPSGAADYRFGVQGGWLLAPTRHGAHNWEGPGLSTAIAALQHLPSVAQALQAPAPNVGRVLVAGHSMGGHGAWLLAMRLGDAAIGLASSASWLRKDQYADSNRVLLHDVATAEVEPALAALLRAGEAEYDVEAQAATLAGAVRALLRVGDQDKTVHPWFSRRMARTLLASGANASDVVLTEIPGKEHWWWDTSQPNDGGAVNDPEMRAFYKESFARASHALAPSLVWSPWRLVVFNAATGGVKGGLRIAQQLVPLRRSSVAVLGAAPGGAGAAALRIETANVGRLEWRSGALKEILRARASAAAAPCGGGQCLDELYVDGNLVHLPPGSHEDGAFLAFCRQPGEGGRAAGAQLWAACGSDLHANGGGGSIERGPATLGPMRQLFARPTCAVVGGDGPLLEAAVYIANLLVMTGHGRLPIINIEDASDSSGQFSPPSTCENLLVLEGGQTAGGAAALLRARPPAGGYEPPLTLGASELGLRGPPGCRWRGSGLAAAALLPWWRQGEQRLALLIAGTSADDVAQAVALLATPTIPPMTRQPFTHLLPDYVILDVNETRARGAGGFLAAGYWSHDWRYSPRSAWERSCVAGDVAAPDDLPGRVEL